MIYLSEAAQHYLTKLANKPENLGKILRLEGMDLHTPQAEVGLRFVDAGPELSDDRMVGFGALQIFVEGRYLTELQETKIDVIKDVLGLELTFDTPHIKPMVLAEDHTLAFKIEYLIENAINPQLAAHGGRVSLVRIQDDAVVVLKFGGGCQGCHRVDQTTKQLIEKILREHCPEIIEVVDETDHSDDAHAFVKCSSDNC